MFELTEQDYDEVVAMQVGNIVYFGMSAVKMALETKRVDKVYVRGLFKLISEMELDPKWAEYAAYPTLFTFKELKEFQKTL